MTSSESRTAPPSLCWAAPAPPFCGEATSHQPPAGRGNAQRGPAAAGAGPWAGAWQLRAADRARGGASTWQAGSLSGPHGRHRRPGGNSFISCPQTCLWFFPCPPPSTWWSPTVTLTLETSLRSTCPLDALPRQSPSRVRPLPGPFPSPQPALCAPGPSMGTASRASPSVRPQWGPCSDVYYRKKKRSNPFVLPLNILRWPPWLSECRGNPLGGIHTWGWPLLTSPRSPAHLHALLY